MAGIPWVLARRLLLEKLSCKFWWFSLEETGGVLTGITIHPELGFL